MAKQLYFIVSFDNVTEALKLERGCKEAGLPGKLVPTPRAFSSSCALSWRAAPEQAAQIQAIIAAQRITVNDLREYEM